MGQRVPDNNQILDAKPLEGADLGAEPSPCPCTLKVPLHPALVLGSFLLLGSGLRWLRPEPLGLPAPWYWILPAAAMLGAFTLAGWGLWTFKRRGTSPEYGGQVQALLCTGPYRFTRNPLFLANALVYLAAALAMDDAGALCLAPLLVLALDRLVIAREEPFLERCFGEAYANYRRRVRRWL